MKTHSIVTYNETKIEIFRLRTKNINPMASVKVALQKQTKYADGYPLIIRAFIGKRTLQFSMGARLQPNQLRIDGKVVKHPDAIAINKAVADSIRIIEEVFAEYESKGVLHTLSTAEIKLAVSLRSKGQKTSIVQEQEKDNKAEHELGATFQELALLKQKSWNTFQQYRFAFNHLKEYAKYINQPFPCYTDINYSYLVNMENYLRNVANLSINSVFVVFKQLRAVYNFAIANEYTSYYPFKRFHVTQEKESPTEPLTSEQIKAIRDIDVEGKTELVRDIFMLEFYLCGINNIDLYYLKYDDKYISYTRRKTGAKMKFEIPDEVRPYMEKYKDPTGVKMFNFHLGESKFTTTINYYIKKVFAALGYTSSQYMYVARHSFATIGMQECDLSYSDIGQLLGHQEHSITSRYARPSEDKKNRNIRKILDTLL